MADITLNELKERLDSIETIILELLQTAQKGVLSVEEAADYIGISRPSLYKLMNSDPGFPVFQPVGMRRRIIPRMALDKWLEENVVERNRLA